MIKEKTHALIITVLFFLFIGIFTGLGAFYTDYYIWNNNLDSALVFSYVVSTGCSTIFVLEKLQNLLRKYDWEKAEKVGDN